MGKTEWLAMLQKTIELGRQRRLSEALAHLLQGLGSGQGGIYARIPEGWKVNVPFGHAPLSLPSVPLKRNAICKVAFSEAASGGQWWAVGIPPTDEMPRYLLLLQLPPERKRRGNEALLLVAELFAHWLDREAEETSLLNSIQEPVLLTDKDGRIVAMNLAAQQTFRDAQSLLGSPIWKLGGDNDDKEALRQLVTTPQEPAIRWVQLGSGEAIFPAQVAVTTCRPNYRLWRFREPSLDEQQIRHLARSFRIATLGELAAGIAHEINNPLQVIMGNAELALDVGKMDEGTKAKLEDILAAAVRIREVARAVTRFADARRTEERELLDFNIVVTEATQLVGYSLVRDGVQVETALAPQLPPVWGRRGDLEEIVVQLVRNAGEAIAETKKGTKVIVRTRLKNGWVRLEVEDDGPGVPPELRERIFDPFVTTKAAKGRTGLGLAIVQNIVAAHQGRLWIEEAPSGGALFVVELPLRQPRMEDWQGRE